MLSLTLLYIYFLRQRSINRLKNSFTSQDSVLVLPFFPIAFYLFLALSFHAFQSELFSRIAVYFGLPALFLYFGRREKPKMQITDLLAILALWLPYDLRFMSPSWRLGEDFGFPMNTLSACIFALIAFGAWRKLDIGLKWRLSLKDLRVVAGAFIILALIIIPLGYSIGFLNFQVTNKPLWQLPLVYLGIFLGIAIPEELIFRGLLQNTLSTRYGLFKSLFIASLMFGSAHLDNGTFPNYKYALLATIAGLGYGYAYTRTKSIIASATVHALVDFTWVLFLHG